MYSALELKVHGLFAMVCLPVLWFKDKMLGFSPPINPLKKNLCGYVAVVTGGNTGVGRETALGLARGGAAVIIGCRSAPRGAAAAASLQRELHAACPKQHPWARSGSVTCLPLDLSSFLSIAAFASSFLAKFAHLDILVNNAGLNKQSVNSNGLQELFMVNYLGHYLLFRLLEPALTTRNVTFDLNDREHDSEARVVNVSSLMHHVGNSDFEKSAFTKYSKGEDSYYADSKLYMNYLTIEINKRFLLRTPPSKGRKVSAISVNPGAVRSDIWRHVPAYLKYPFDLFMRAYFLTVEQGAATSLFGATAKVNVDEPILPLPLLPYVVPYRVHFGWLAFEALGPFGGAIFGTPTLPPDSVEKALELWRFSRDVINQIISSCEESNDKKFIIQALSLSNEVES